MSEPTTEAGKALVAAMFGDTWDMPDDPGGAIAAIEAEAAAQERERIAEAVRRLEPTNGYDWAAGFAEARAAALAIVR